MPMYNLIEYNDNYSDTSGRLWNFKRDEIEGDIDLTIDNASSFKYKANPTGNTENNRKKKWCKKSYTTKIFKQFSEIFRNAIN